MKRELGIFLTLTFVATVVLAVLGKTVNRSFGTMIMLVPMLSAMATQKWVLRRPVFRGGELGFRGGKLRWLFFGPLLFALYVAATLAITWLLVPASRVSGAELSQRLHDIDLFNGLTDGWKLAAVMAIDGLLGPIVNLPIFLGEEVGWRAFMVPRLEQQFGRRGVLIGGVIWALWHLPMIFLFGLNYPDDPWLGLVIWVPLCMAMGVVLQHIYRKSGSVFAVALAHGAMNKTAALGLLLLLHGEQGSRLLFGPAGLVGLALMVPLALALYPRGAAASTPLTAHLERRAVE